MLRIVLLVILFMGGGMMASEGKTMQQATIGGGCFWCLEAVYDGMKGVEEAVSGYAGGEMENPDYKTVSSGSTGHAEVVQITFDPEVVSFEQILDVFWNIHDPTTLNRQGADVGTQYRSTILYHDEAQKKIAEESLQKANPKWGAKIVTEIAPLEKFWPAEEYHQNYYANNPNQGYCQVVIRPKLDKFKNKHGDLLR